jgi:DNA-binding PucR family transcriptional regulator
MMPDDHRDRAEHVQDRDRVRRPDLRGDRRGLHARTGKLAAGLAADDEHHARLRETLLVFLHTGGSYKATAERLVLHKNTVQYRIRKAEESLGRPVSENRHDVELALRASHWLGSSVLQPNQERPPAPTGTA